MIFCLLLAFLITIAVVGAIKSENFPTHINPSNFTVTNEFAKRVNIPREEFEFIFEQIVRIHEQRKLAERMLISVSGFICFHFA